MSTEFLRAHAQTLQDFADATSSRANADPSNFWLNLAAKNQIQAAQKVKYSLQTAYAEEVGELVDLRFIGPQANGSIPLESFLRITEPLLKAWKAAAFRLRHGIVHHKIDTEIGDILNLRLAGLAPGSTHVFLTGNASTDLSGESLLESTLNQTFRLLNTDNDNFYDAVDAVGAKSAKYFGDALKAISSAGLSAEFTWSSKEEVKHWAGSTDEMTRLRALIASVSAPESYDEYITGVVSGIKDTGRLDVRTEQGRVSIRFPLDLTSSVQQLAIAKPATIHVKTTKYQDSVSKKDIFKRIMLGLSVNNPAPQLPLPPSKIQFRE